MANIDLQSLISQLSSSNGTASGAKAGAQSGAAGQLFGNILGQQQQGIAPELLAGKDLPGGKQAAMAQALQMNQVPVNVDLANMLAKLAQMPNQSASLPMQELQAQMQQLMQSEPTSEVSLDDLTALTSLMAGTDAAMPHLTTAVSSNVTLNSASLDSPVALDDPELLQMAQQMGIDPAVANYILQATQALNTTQASADASVATGAVANSTTTPTPAINPTDTARVLGTANALNNSLATAVPGVTVNPVTADPSVAGAAAQVGRNAAQINPNPTAANPNANAVNSVTVQQAAQEITDDVVIRVRQAGAEAVTNATANNVAAVSAQDFFRQRGIQAGGTSNASPVNPNQMSETAAGESLLRMPEALIQKLDLVGQTAQATTPATPEAMAAPLTGASFKSMAQFNGLTVGQPAATTTAEVPVAEGGSRLQSLLQGDNPAQQAARNMQNQVGQQLQRMVRDGQWQANINLNPARLGQIKINMTMEDGVLTTQLLSGNQGVRELLEGGMPRLRELLEESGLQLGQVDVSSDGNQQQFAEQDAQTGEVNQLQAEESVASSSANANTSNHDGDLDTFA